MSPLCIFYAYFMDILWIYYVYSSFYRYFMYNLRFFFFYRVDVIMIFLTITVTSPLKKLKYLVLRNNDLPDKLKIFCHIFSISIFFIKFFIYCTINIYLVICILLFLFNS